MEQRVLNLENHSQKKYLYESRINAETDLIIKRSQAGASYDTLSPFFRSYDRLFFASASKKTVSSTYFISVFNPDFWFCILSIYFLLLAFIVVYKRLYKLTWNQFYSAILHVIGISTEDSIQCRTFSLNLCTIIYLILFYILGECFSAFLTTELSISTEPKPQFQFIEEFSYQSKYKICTTPYSYNYYELKKQNKYNHILNAK